MRQTRPFAWNVTGGSVWWLTFCCLHSLQALRLPPRRLPVTGGVLSISPDSGLLCMNSTPGGRGSLGVRKSPWGIKDGPLGAKRFRYSKSIEIGLTRYKNPVKRKFCSVVRICRKSEKSADEESREEEKHARLADPSAVGFCLRLQSCLRRHGNIDSLHGSHR